MTQTETFNAAGDVIAVESFHNPAGALKLARIAFSIDCCVAINGVDCFTFAEAERAIRKQFAEVVA